MKQNCVNLTGLSSNQNVSELMLEFLLSLLAVSLSPLLWTDFTSSFRFLKSPEGYPEVQSGGSQQSV